jgi:hypothetical protein
MPKAYAYKFSYYWKVSWPDDETFKLDTINYKGFKQRIKRECKVVNPDSVVLYINLRWVTTLGRMQSLFPSSTLIETSTPEEFQEIKDTKEVKQSPSKKTYRIKRILEPSEEYSYSLNEIQTRQKTRALNKRRRKFLEPDSSIPDEPVPYGSHEDGFDVDIDLLKKKIHKEDEERSVQSTDDSSVDHQKNHHIFIDHNDCLHEDLYPEDKEVDKVDDVNRRNEGKEGQNFDFLWEDSLGPVWEIDDIGQEYIPKKIRNFGLETTLSPSIWEYEYQSNVNMDLM